MISHGYRFDSALILSLTVGDGLLAAIVNAGSTGRLTNVARRTVRERRRTGLRTTGGTVNCTAASAGR